MTLEALEEFLVQTLEWVVEFSIQNFQVEFEVFWKKIMGRVLRNTLEETLNITEEILTIIFEWNFEKCLIFYVMKILMKVNIPAVTRLSLFSEKSLVASRVKWSQNIWFRALRNTCITPNTIIWNQFQCIW